MYLQEEVYNITINKHYYILYFTRGLLHVVVRMRVLYVRVDFRHF